MEQNKPTHSQQSRKLTEAEKEKMKAKEALKKEQKAAQEVITKAQQRKNEEDGKNFY